MAYITTEQIETRQCERCDEDRPDAEMRTKDVCNECSEAEAEAEEMGR